MIWNNIYRFFFFRNWLEYDIASKPHKIFVVKDWKFLIWSNSWKTWPLLLPNIWKKKTEDSFFLECHARLCYASANLVNVKCYQEKSRLKKPQKSISQLQKKKRSAFYPFLTSFAKRLRLPKNRFEYTYAVYSILLFSRKHNEISKTIYC